MNYSYYNPYAGYYNQSLQQGYQPPVIQQPMQQTMQMPVQPQPQAQPQNPIQQPQQVYYPLTYVSGIEGAKAFIVSPNQTIYLLDSDDSKIMYIKSADSAGKYTMNKVKLVSENEEIPDKKNDIKYASKEDLDDLYTKIKKLISSKLKEDKDNE